MSLEAMLDRACNASRIEHEVVESPQEVRVKVVAHDAALSEDCGMGTGIPLAEPLGSRRLVDGATGDLLRCGPSEGRTVCEPPPG